MTESSWERKLNIRTAGTTTHVADGENYPYEPTPYSVLERLAGSGCLTRDNVLVDYGCGKGRVSFTLSYLTGCRVIGIDYNERLIQIAEANRERSGMKRIEFINGKAEEYELTDEDAFFFFNPFSEIVLKQVVGQIIWSWYENPRKMRLFFYYPSDEQVGILMTTPELLFTDEIDCSDLFSGNSRRERILFFETM